MCHVLVRTNSNISSYAALDNLFFHNREYVGFEMDKS